MPVKPCPLTINRHNQETANRGTPMFPCGGYITTVDNGLCHDIPWHWHDEVEVFVVQEGSLILELVGRQFELHSGDGAFINAGTLQSARAANGDDCELNTLVFHPRLISGGLESAVEQRYVRPLLDCCALPVIRLKKDIQWQCSAIQNILDAFAAYEAGIYGYELLVQENLSHLWFLLVQNNENLLKKSSSASVDALRMKDMLAFIHQSYADSITLTDISNAAAISKRECLRCFKRAISQTPMKYLLSHRISVAADLLKTTHLSITEICKQCGFESPSYFSMMFKKLIEKTPKEYRSEG